MVLKTNILTGHFPTHQHEESVNVIKECREVLWIEGLGGFGPVV